MSWRRLALCLSLAAAGCMSITAAAAAPPLAAGPAEMAAHNDRITGASTIIARFSGIPQRRNRVGAVRASVTITVFGDVASSLTRRLSERTVPALLRCYVRSGRVKMIFRPVAAISISSERGALAADAAAYQDSLWPMASLLLRNQGPEGRDWLSEDEVITAARRLGLDPDKLARDYGGKRVARDFFRDDALWRASGVSTVPASVVRGPHGRRLIVGAPGPRSFAAAISAVS